MIKMILADDEPFVRNGLKNVFRWDEEFGIEIVAEASDGLEAYEMCLVHQPDILFTDIMMPLMDGLEVAEKLKADNSPAKIIIISGAQDFAYARTALEVNAEGYILKPVKLEEVRQVFRKVVDEIHQERQSRMNLEQLRQQLEENTPLIRDKFLQNMLSGFYRNEQEIWPKVEYFRIPVRQDDVFTVGVLQLDDYRTALNKFSEESKQLLYFSIQNIIEELMSACQAGISFTARENEFILLFRSAESLFPETYNRLCEQVVSGINRYLKLSVSIGIGKSVPSLTRIEDSYKDALTALTHKFYTGPGSILYINELQPETETLQSAYFYKFHAGFMSALKIGNTGKVLDLLDELFDHLARPKLQIDYVQSICAEIIFTSARTLYEVDENIERVLNDRITIMDELYKKQSIRALKDYMVVMFSDLAEYLAGKNSTKNSRTIGRIKEIIREAYDQNLTVTKIAEKVFLTPNYISLIFKQGTGETITDYITRIRIDQAKRLLESTDFKVMEIAKRVGYENPHYFSTVFKKATGMHPLKYRSSLSAPLEQG
ncbi:response regulator [Paenibacillus caui]|uniref:response regulator n=1 Tax=Paenibacillus caui TaxID=2873927 RepID=UPI001CAA191C|nr:response regulator [Paenibacillus caui]